MDQSITKKDIDQLLSDKAKLTNGYCHVTVKNACPPAWGIKIGGAVGFYYHDVNGKPDGQYTDYHDNLDIPSGSTLSFKSNQKEGCVGETRLVLEVVDRNGNRERYGAIDETEAGLCLILVPKEFGPVSEVESLDFSELVLRKKSL